MDTIKLKAFVNRSRQLTMELPASFPVGEVEITVQAPLELFIATGAHPWSDDELDSLLDFNPVAARNLAIGGWSKQTASAADHLRFVDSSRRRH